VVARVSAERTPSSSRCLAVCYAKHPHEISGEEYEYQCQLRSGHREPHRREWTERVKVGYQRTEPRLLSVSWYGHMVTVGS
jgi:hypothetical protein